MTAWISPVADAAWRDPTPVAAMQWLTDHRQQLTIGAGLLIGLAVAWLVGRDALLAWRHRRLSTGARWVRIAAPPEVARHAGAALWLTLAGVLTPSWRQRLRYGIPHVAWEYAWSGRMLTIGIWVPGTIPPGAVEAAVRAAWPGSACTTQPAAAPIAPPVTAEAGGALWPQAPDVLPLRTDHDDDPLRSLLAAGAGLGHLEGACLQVLARPAHPRRARAARAATARAATTGVLAGDGGPGPSAGYPGGDRAARALSGGTQLAASLLVEPVSWIADALLPGARRTGRGVPAHHPSPTSLAGSARRDPVGDVRRRAAADKAASVPHWQIAVRYAVATRASVTGTDQRRNEHRQRERMAGLAHTLASASAAYARPNALRRMRMRDPVAVLAGRRLRAGFLATVEELGVLAALPQDLAVPGLDRARARAVPAPAEVPTGGRGVKVLGRAQVGGHAVGLPVIDARQHVHLIGKTGVGKSTLLLNMILSDVHGGRGVVVIDPRGDLVTDVLDRLPERFTRAGRKLAIIDPAQPNPAHFNPLDVAAGSGGLQGDGADVHLAVDNIVGTFARIFERHWGPRMDDTLRVACLTLMRQPLATLTLVPAMLSRPSFRAPFTADLRDSEGLGGFWEWYDAMPDAMRAQVIGPVLARLRAFLLRGFVRDVIGHPTSSFAMAEILDGGLLLCRLPKGVLGEETARILGSLIVARVWQAAIGRAAVPEAKRRDATLFVDEAHNFLNLPGSVDDMLAEARGFRLGLVLAHQNLAQLPHETAAAISANARSKIVFNVDPADARDLARHTAPELGEHDLARLDVHTAAARLLVGNRELPAFTLTTNPPSAPLGHADAIRAAAAITHARDVDPQSDGLSDPS